MRKKHRILQGAYFKKKIAVLLQRSFYAGALYGGISPVRTDRITCSCSNGTMASMSRSVLYAPTYSRAGWANSIPTHHNRPQHFLQNHYDQQPDSRHYAANDGRARGRSCSALHYSTRLEYYPPISIADFIVDSNEQPTILF
jgi:hypothetical protein